MPVSRPGLVDYVLLLLLASFWGGSFILIKLAVHDIPPASMTAGRLLLGALLLYFVVRLTGESSRFDRRSLLLIFLIGLFGNAVPFMLISWAEETVDAGLASILMGIMPIATLLMAHFFSTGEPLTARKMAGVTIGFAGLVILVGPAVLLRLGDDGVRQLALLAAAVCYGVNAILTKELLGLPRRAAGAAILLAGALATLPIALLFEQPWTLRPDSTSIAAVGLLALLSTAIAALLVFEILERQGAGFFGQVNLLVPLFGVAWAALILGERPDPAAVVALVFILAGILFAGGGSRSAVVKEQSG